MLADMADYADMFGDDGQDASGGGSHEGEVRKCPAIVGTLV